MTGRRKVYILSAWLVLCTLTAGAQQTIQFSQYEFDVLAVNPAYAGYKEDWTLNFISRIQWVGFPGAPQTGIISIDGLANSDNPNVGLGLIASFDRLGPETISSIYANYSYRLRLDELDTKRLCFGIAFGGIQYNLNGAAFVATEAGDASVPTGEESKVSPDFRFGIYYYSPNVYFGASVLNLLAQTIDDITNDEPLIKPARTYYLTGGALIPLSEEVDVKPSLMIKEDFMGPTNLDLTSYLAFKKVVWFGISYSTGVPIFAKTNLQSNLENADAVTAVAQFFVNDHFRLGYSFDFTVTKLANYQGGSHEISLSLSFPHKKPRIVSPRYF